MIGRTPEIESNPKALILDSNVAIDIEKRHNGFLNERDRISLERIFRMHENCDVLLGFALSETCWEWSEQRRSVVGPNIRKWRMMVEAADSFLNGVDSSDPPPNLTSFITPGYLTLLKFLHLMKKEKCKEKILLFRRLIEWVHLEAQINMGYEIQVATDYILNGKRTREYVEKLTKMNRPTGQLGALWFAAWDLFLLRLPGFAAGGMPGFDTREAVLLTTDTALVELHCRCPFLCVIEGSSPFAMVGAFRNDTSYTQKHWDEIERIARWSKLQSIKREQSNFLSRPSKWEELKSRLEDELLAD